MFTDPDGKDKFLAWLLGGAYQDDSTWDALKGALSPGPMLNSSTKDSVRTLPIFTQEYRYGSRNKPTDHTATSSPSGWGTQSSLRDGKIST